MDEKKASMISEEQLSQASGGVDVSMYSEEELAKIFDLHFEMYGDVGALPYLAGWGVTTGDYYVIVRDQFWENTPYQGSTLGWKLAHLVYQRNH